MPPASAAAAAATAAAASTAAATSTAAAAAPRKLRLLCLHGYVQSGALFRERTGSLRKALKSVAEFEFVDAPHDASGAFPETSAPSAADGGEGEGGAAAAAGGGAGAEEGDAGGSAAAASAASSRAACDGTASVADARGWWSSGENAPASAATSAAATSAAWVRPSLSRAALGADVSLQHLRDVIATRGPFDGLLGFSQGAAMAGLLLAVDPSCARFAILIAGFVPMDESLRGLYGNADDSADVAPASRLPHAVLSVSGEGDALVPPARVRQLAGRFDTEKAAWYTHPGGHGVPSNAAFRAVVKAFVAAQATPQATQA